jgi:hypothetical protein
MADNSRSAKLTENPVIITLSRQNCRLINGYVENLPSNHTVMRVTIQREADATKNSGLNSGVVEGGVRKSRWHRESSKL